MKRYLKLVNFEFNRFLKIYLTLIGIVVLFQMVGVIVNSQRYVSLAEEILNEGILPTSTFLEQYGQMSFLKITGTPWFFGPIMLSIATLIIYVFFIWYRDWLGKNTFIYRLLMLPTERINVYFAKATTILLLVLGLIALQLLLIPIESQIMRWIVPEEYVMNFTVKEITTSQDLIIFFPYTLTEFVVYYGGGISVVCIVFTAILFERSYRLKGVIYWILYCAASLLIFIAPLLVDSFLLDNYFYPLELLALEVAMALLVLTIAIWTGNYLLKNKVRV